MPARKPETDPILKKMEITTQNPEETLILGEKLGKTLQSGDILLLYGDLGAGKTTLTQGICYGLGLARKEYIRSPTFTLINEYKGKGPIYHIDLYRVDTLEEIENLGLEEVLFGEGVSIVEWAEKLQTSAYGKSVGLEEHPHITVKITYTHENKRSFAIEPVNMTDRASPLFSLQ